MGNVLFFQHLNQLQGMDIYIYIPAKGIRGVLRHEAAHQLANQEGTEFTLEHARGLERREMLWNPEDFCLGFVFLDASVWLRVM